MMTLLFHAASIETAAAQHPNLTWQAPSECPAWEQVQGQILTLAQSPDAFNGLRIHATIQKGEDGRFSLALAIQRAEGLPATRSLSAHECGALTDAAVWLIALALQAPDTSASRPISPARRVDDGRPASIRGDSLDEAPAQQTRAARSYRLRLGVFAGVIAQGLAGPQGLAGARGGLGWRRSYTELGLQHAFARRMRLPGGASAVFDGQSLALTQCAEFSVGVSLLPCLGLDAERTHGRTTGLLAPRETAAFWLGASAAVRAFVPLGSSIELAVDLTLRLPLTDRPRFVIQGFGEFAEIRYASFTTTLGLLAHF